MLKSYAFKKNALSRSGLLIAAQLSVITAKVEITKDPIALTVVGWLSVPLFQHDKNLSGDNIHCPIFKLNIEYYIN